MRGRAEMFRRGEGTEVAAWLSLAPIFLPHISYLMGPYLCAFSPCRCSAAKPIPKCSDVMNEPSRIASRASAPHWGH